MAHLIVCRILMFTLFAVDVMEDANLPVEGGSVSVVEEEASLPRPDSDHLSLRLENHPGPDPPAPQTTLPPIPEVDEQPVRTDIPGLYY